MKSTGTPFTWLDGRPFVVCNFTLDASFGFPSLPDLLERLLGKYHGDDILILRRLNSEETELLEDSIQEREHETWAQIAATDEREER